MINFNEPPFVGIEMGYVKQAVDNKKICGDGEFTRRFQRMDKAAHGHYEDVSNLE